MLVAAKRDPKVVIDLRMTFRCGEPPTVGVTIDVIARFDGEIHVVAARVLRAEWQSEGEGSSSGENRKNLFG